MKRNITIKHLGYWMLGFVVLFLFNVFVEYFVLTWLDMHNTPANDPYFIAWWCAVIFWLLFGWQLIGKKLNPH